ncbi:MAG: replication restart helicase PriA [Coriobacteriales bacterium]
MLIASCIVDVPTRALDRSFDYLVPEELGGVAVGCAVSVDFSHRLAVAYVMGLEEMDAETLEARGVAPGKLKPLLGILSAPYFDKEAAELVFWISKRYLCPVSNALTLFTPPGGSPKVKRIEGSWQLVHPGVGPVDDRWVFPTEAAATFKPAKNAVKQKALLEALSEGGMRIAELSLELGSVNATVKSLEKRGVVRVEHRRRLRTAMAGVERPCVELSQLTEGQENALCAIRASLDGTDDAHDHVVVVDGITGSGKTEVYLRAISEVLEAGKGAIVLVPEISLTPQTVGRFRARFGDDVAVLHSRLSIGERFDQWDLVRSGAVHVVVGTRSALFAPLSDIGLVIIDEEHESSYKQESAPRYNARDVALKLCELHGATLVLGSATPSIDTLASCEDGSIQSRNWRRVELPERPNGYPLPPVTVVDMGREFTSGSRSMFSAALVQALDEVHERHEKAVLLLNKRGFASFLLCRECGFVPECPDCAVSLTYHERGNYLSCHHCDHREPVPARCPRCGSPYLRKFGTGTERVEAQLSQIVPADMPIVRMDADTTKGKGAHERLLEQFRANDGGILLGTQMIAKGLDFPDVTLVGVINADTTLKLPDFRAPERTFQLLEQVSGRAGRAEKPGRVIVQTYWPEHPAIRAAAAHDRSIFLAEELPAREELGYPPYARLANVLIWGKREGDVRQVATELSLAVNSALVSAGKEWPVLGPTPCLLSRLRGYFRWHILIKAPVEEDVSGLLDGILKKRKVSREVRVAVDVDPYDLF